MQMRSGQCVLVGLGKVGKNLDSMSGGRGIWEHHGNLLHWGELGYHATGAGGVTLLEREEHAFWGGENQIS